MLGCSQYIDPNVPEPIHRVLEPSVGGEYLLYRPSGYDRAREWPLVVACHGGFGDSPAAQVRQWTQLAEENGFLVIVPRLSSAGGGFGAGGEKFQQKLRDDEQMILAAVQHIRAGHSISDDRVLMAGWGAGAHAALYVGLSHPDAFRAIGLDHPRFSAAFLGEVARQVDPNQAVAVLHDVGDSFRGSAGAKCAQWLRERGIDVKEETAGVAPHQESRKIMSFFEDTLRTRAWLRMRAFSPSREQPLEFRFKLQASVEPVRFLWTFGDGDDSPMAAPAHRYTAAGTYRVAVRVELPDGSNHVRAMDLTVPQGILAQPGRASEP